MSAQHNVGAALGAVESALSYVGAAEHTGELPAIQSELARAALDDARRILSRYRER